MSVSTIFAASRNCLHQIAWRHKMRSSPQISQMEFELESLQFSTLSMSNITRQRQTLDMQKYDEHAYE